MERVKLKVFLLDFETTAQKLDNNKYPLPFDERNHLVSVGYAEGVYNGEDSLLGEIEYDIIEHTEFKMGLQDTYDLLQKLREKILECDLFIAYNAKFELLWFSAISLPQPNKIYDPMLAEYIIQRGLKNPLNLEAVSLKYGGAEKKKDIISEYWDKGIGFESMPIPIVKEYGIADIASMWDVFLSQMKYFNSDEGKGLIPSLELTNEYCILLSEMETNGIAVNTDALHDLQSVLEEERDTITKELTKKVQDIMGDRLYNLNSSEDLSKIIFSREMKHKHQWKDIFKLGNSYKNKYPKKYPNSMFANIIKNNTNIVFKEEAFQCPECKGVGRIQKHNKDGRPSKRLNRCPKCFTDGVVYTSTKEVAGFKCAHINPSGVSANGFQTNSDNLEYILDRTNDEELKDFLNKIMRLNKLNTYIDTFVLGSFRGIKSDGLLHTQFNQTVTFTGRLSSKEPNLQNSPRGDKFPLRECFVSRFDDGQLVECDFAKLEYLVAVCLAKDPVGMQDIIDGVDAHTITADIIKTNRQDAKAHTFKPLYGGMSGTTDQINYYKFFLEKHARIAQWHKELQDEAIKTGKIILPSGREYAFPYAKRTKNGGATGATKIKNYPVQGFATADIVPIGLIEVHKAMYKDLGMKKSLLVLTVHDNGVIDEHPDEKGLGVEAFKLGFGRVKEQLLYRYNYEFPLEFAFEIAVGDNLLNKKEVYSGV